MTPRRSRIPCRPLLAGAALFLAVPLRISLSAGLPDDVVLSLELLEGSGGVPARVRLTFHNRGRRTASILEPVPLVPGDWPSYTAPPAGPLWRLALRFRDTQGEPVLFDAVLTAVPREDGPDPGARTPASPVRPLGPGARWAPEYGLSAFRFWGPCGPAVDLASSLSPGDTEVRVSALLVSDSGELRETQPVTFRCRPPEFFFGPLEDDAQVERIEEIMAPALGAGGRREVLEIRPELAAALARDLEGDRFDIKVEAALMLSMSLESPVAAKAVLPAARRLLGKGKRPADRLLGAHLLRALGSRARQGLPELRRATVDAHPRVRELAIEAVRAITGEKPPPGEEITYDGKTVEHWLRVAGGSLEPGEWDRAYRALESFGVRALPAYLQALESENRGAAGAAASQLARLIADGRVGVEILAEPLRSRNAGARLGAARAATWSRKAPAAGGRAPALPDAVLTALLALLDDPDLEVRQEAAQALSGPGAEAAVGALLKELRENSAPLARASAAIALAALARPDPEVHQTLEAALEDKSAFVRDAAERVRISLGWPPRLVSFGQRLEALYPGEAVRAKVRRSAAEAWVPPRAGALVLVVDRSIHPAGAFRKVEELLRRAVESLPEGTAFAVVFFADRTRRFPEEGPPVPASAAGGRAALEAAARVESGSGSCGFRAGLLDGVDLALAAASEGAERPAVVLITAGRTDCSELRFHEDVIAEEAIDAVTARNRGRVAIHVLAAAPSRSSERMLLHLAEENGGTCTRLLGLSR